MRRWADASRVLSFGGDRRGCTRRDAGGTTAASPLRDGQRSDIAVVRSRPAEGIFARGLAAGPNDVSRRACARHQDRAGSRPRRAALPRTT